jgi:hypothetical protein
VSIPLLARWREECARALAHADPAGADDAKVALILGSYFEALASWTAMERAEPQVQRCEAEATRFLAMLRTVPSRRQRLADEREVRLRESGLLVFPPSTDQGDAP